MIDSYADQAEWVIWKGLHYNTPTADNFELAHRAIQALSDAGWMIFPPNHKIGRFLDDAGTT